MKLYKKEEGKPKDREIDNSDDWEAEQNWLGFFSLLLEADKKINPHLYKNSKDCN